MPAYAVRILSAMSGQYLARTPRNAGARSRAASVPEMTLPKGVAKSLPYSPGKFAPCAAASCGVRRLTAASPVVRCRGWEVPGGGPLLGACSNSALHLGQ